MFKILSTILFGAVRFGGCIAFAWWLCDISSSEHYEWLSGVWYGIMFVPNWLRSLLMMVFSIKLWIILQGIMLLGGYSVSYHA